VLCKAADFTSVKVCTARKLTLNSHTTNEGRLLLDGGVRRVPIVHSDLLPCVLRVEFPSFPARPNK
jgi:hypothetical protein